MTKFAQIAVAAGFALATCLFASASLATNTREAIRACDSNPQCKFDVGADGVVISVGGKLITCPVKNGPCGVATRTSHGVHDFSGLNGNLEYQSAE